MRVLAAIGVIVFAVLSLIGTYLGTIEGLRFVAEAPVPQLTLLALLAFLWLWARSAGVNLFRPHTAYLDDLRRETRQRLQDAREVPVSEMEADEQVQRWEHFRAWLARVIRKLCKTTPEDLSQAFYADVHSGLERAKPNAGAASYRDKFTSLLMVPKGFDGFSGPTSKSIEATCAYLRDLHATVMPWDLSAAFRLEQFGHPLRD